LRYSSLTPFLPISSPPGNLSELRRPSSSSRMTDDPPDGREVPAEESGTRGVAVFTRRRPRYRVVAARLLLQGVQARRRTAPLGLGNLDALAFVARRRCIPSTKRSSPSQTCQLSPDQIPSPPIPSPTKRL
jgi:hypothetical protein